MKLTEYIDKELKLVDENVLMKVIKNSMNEKIGRELPKESKIKYSRIIYTRRFEEDFIGRIILNINKKYYIATLDIYKGLIISFLYCQNKQRLIKALLEL